MTTLVASSSGFIRLWWMLEILFSKKWNDSGFLKRIKRKTLSLRKAWDSSLEGIQRRKPRTRLKISRISNFQVAYFVLQLLSAVEPRVVKWNLVTKGESDSKLLMVLLDYEYTLVEIRLFFC
ncbi:hypothetical protein L2E82_45822 [Cichorium intybus]|uniref:Uncharacterized protein n=1 Tax=Cichorium intybus TaxID=13427 RepID=A0ACB8ZUX7_CICIN|nr:hypothetical protein L2E82_45822 [Cichorium intybus]